MRHAGGRESRSYTDGRRDPLLRGDDRMFIRRLVNYRQRFRMDRPHSPFGRGRRMVVELLEQRTPLNGNPLVAAVPDATMAPLPLAPSSLHPAATGGNSAADPATATPGSQAGALAASEPTASTSASQGAASTGASGDPAGGLQPAAGSPQQGVISLLFDPHQPKSGLPADVTFSGGPPLQQGAPPRFSYNLETNITGGSKLGPHALLVAEQGTDLAGTFADNKHAYVASSPHGVPNFSFGPDTWVFGPQAAPSGRRTIENRSIRGQEGNERGQLPIEESPSQRGGDETGEERENDRSSENRRSESRPLQSAEAASDSPSERANWAAFADEALFVDLDFSGLDELDLGELAAAAASRRQHLAGESHRVAEAGATTDLSVRDASRLTVTEPINAPTDERAGPLAAAASLAGALAPAALADRAVRRRPADRRSWSRPTERLRLERERRLPVLRE